MPKTVRYYFELPGNVTHDFAFDLNTETFQVETGPRPHQPEWTKLGYQQCRHCPLSDAEYCPVAANICNIILPMGATISFETVTCRVVMEERTSLTTTSAQEALRSLMQFVISASSCPHTDFLKPLARFHVPFASLEEVVSRLASTYLLFQYFRKEQGHEFDHGLNGLYEFCKNFEIIGMAMAERLKAETLAGDAGPNALVILHGFSQFIQIYIDHHLDIIRPAFEPALQRCDAASPPEPRPAARARAAAPTRTTARDRCGPADPGFRPPKRHKRARPSPPVPLVGSPK